MKTLVWDVRSSSGVRGIDTRYFTLGLVRALCLRFSQKKTGFERLILASDSFSIEYLSLAVEYGSFLVLWTFSGVSQEKWVQNCAENLKSYGPLVWTCVINVDPYAWFLPPSSSWIEVCPLILNGPESGKILKNFQKKRRMEKLLKGASQVFFLGDKKDPLFEEVLPLVPCKTLGFATDDISSFSLKKNEKLKIVALVEPSHEPWVASLQGDFEVVFWHKNFSSELLEERCLFVLTQKQLGASYEALEFLLRGSSVLALEETPLSSMLSRSPLPVTFFYGASFQEKLWKGYLCDMIKPNKEHEDLEKRALKVGMKKVLEERLKRTFSWQDQIDLWLKEVTS